MSALVSDRPKLCVALFAGVALVAPMPDAVAQVVPDGGTATSVSTDAAGVSTVSIAPSSPSGISHNTYTEFSVPAAGVNLDNRSAIARTILNEVTSSRISNLNGALEVLGAPAHVILANPNGIVVDGGVFINTGGVALSTGSASITTHKAPGVSMDNVVLETASGRIDVTGAGLSGAMASLQLLAGEIRIDGPVESRSESARSEILLHAGSSRVEYDSAVLPNADLESWGELSVVPATAANSTAIEITERGSLKASTVRILATDNGAGVTHAGSGLAASGDFVIDASGKVAIASNIKAARHVTIKGAEIEARSNVRKSQATVEAVSGALTLVAASGDIANTGVLMSGATRDADNVLSKGGVTLEAAGDIRLLSEHADQLAIVFASAENLDVHASGSITNNTGRLLANGKTRIDAGGDITNTIDIVEGASPAGEWTYREDVGKRIWYSLWQKRLVTTYASLDYGHERIAGQQAYIVGSDIMLTATGNVANIGGSINANGDAAGFGGSVSIEAVAIDNRSPATGSLSFIQTCGLSCIGSGRSDIALLGGAINGHSDVVLKARDAISNTGQVTSYGDLDLQAPEVTIEGTRIAGIYRRSPGLYNFWGGSSIWMGELDVGGVMTAPLGSIAIEAFKPVIVDAGVLEARNGVTVPGGVALVRAPLTGLTTAKRPVGHFSQLLGE